MRGPDQRAPNAVDIGKCDGTAYRRLQLLEDSERALRAGPDSPMARTPQGFDDVVGKPRSGPRRKLHAELTRSHEAAIRSAEQLFARRHPRRNRTRRHRTHFCEAETGRGELRRELGVFGGNAGVVFDRLADKAAIGGVDRTGDVSNRARCDISQTVKRILRVLRWRRAFRVTLPRRHPGTPELLDAAPHLLPSL